jgi:succinate dehydrogenase / fumarate reductase membrane anchor subunit
MSGKTDAPRVAVMRSHLGRARGLGAAGTGVHHWWAQRVGSVALLPLTAWFVVTMLRLAPLSRAAALNDLHNPWNATLLIAFILVTFQHMQLGLQVVIEDYLHGATRTAVMLAMRGAVALVALACLLAALRIAI